MTEEGPRKPKSPARFIAVGCTVVVALAVVIAVFAGFAFYKISRGMDEVAEVGSSWLARQPEAQEEFGGVQRVERIQTPFDMQIKNDGGEAWFEYRILGAKASGTARVYLARVQREWRAVAADLRLGDRTVSIGKQTLYKTPRREP